MSDIQVYRVQCPFRHATSYESRTGFTINWNLPAPSHEAALEFKPGDVLVVFPSDTTPGRIFIHRRIGKNRQTEATAPTADQIRQMVSRGQIRLMQ